MAKVYFDKEKNNWFIDSLEDYYMFKSINSKTNEEYSKEGTSCFHL